MGGAIGGDGALPSSHGMGGTGFGSRDYYPSTKMGGQCCPCCGYDDCGCCGCSIM